MRPPRSSNAAATPLPRLSRDVDLLDLVVLHHHEADEG
jgi:hypothetical protein